MAGGWVTTSLLPEGLLEVIITYLRSEFVYRLTVVHADFNDEFFGVHDLRHTSASLLIREGLPGKVIQERLGHSSIKTTLDTYGHLFEGMDRDAADLLDAGARGVIVGLGRHDSA